MSCLVCVRLEVSWLQYKTLCSVAKAFIVKLIRHYLFFLFFWGFFFVYFAVTKHTSILWCQVGRSAVPLWTKSIKKKSFPSLVWKRLISLQTHPTWLGWTGTWTVIRPDYQHQFAPLSEQEQVQHLVESVRAEEWRLFEQHSNEHGFGQTCSAITYGHNVLVFPFLWRRSLPPLTLDQFPPPTVLSIFLALPLGIFI